MDEKNLSTPQAIMAFGLTNIGCDQSGAVFQTIVQAPSASESQNTERQQQFCTYIVPNAPKSREEIEDDLVRGATKSAKVFANLLMRYEKLGYLDFRGEPTSDIYEYLQKRYNLNYDLDNFRHVFKPSVK